MNKKEYNAPEMEVIAIEKIDIITGSVEDGKTEDWGLGLVPL